jgi:predicted DNA-binding transcriptional regulator AlpA
MSTDGSRTATPMKATVDVLTVEEFCAELKVSKDTFYHWRKVGTAPVCHRLPNGELRISRADRDAWLAKLRDVA